MSALFSHPLSAAWVGDVPRQTPHFLEVFLVIESDDDNEDDGVVEDASDGSSDARDVGESDESDESSNDDIPDEVLRPMRRQVGGMENKIGRVLHSLYTAS